MTALEKLHEWFCAYRIWHAVRAQAIRDRSEALRRMRDVPRLPIPDAARRAGAI